MKTLTFKGIQCDSFRDAVETAGVYDWRSAVLRDGRIFAMPEDDLRTLEYADAIDATIHYNDAAGRILTVPVD